MTGSFLRALESEAVVVRSICGILEHFARRMSRLNHFIFNQRPIAKLAAVGYKPLPPVASANSSGNFTPVIH